MYELIHRAGSLAVLLVLTAACNNEPTSSSTDALSQQSTSTPALHCAGLSGFAAAGLSITSAESRETLVGESLGLVPETTRVEIAHCRVAGTIDGTIGFELLLPDTWNGKFLMGGGGGFVGSIQNSAQDTSLIFGGTALERGYATAGTDTGHQAHSIDGSWALNNSQAQEDFGHRAVHRTAEISKAIIASYYTTEAERSYFFGCSRGGGQALMSAQRYPADFDGLVAGAPALDWTGFAGGGLRAQQNVFPDLMNLSTPVITTANRELLADSILGQCDAIDGVTDGVLTDPRACPFDPATLPRCESGPDAACLTETQLAAIQAIYEPLLVNGDQIYTGWPLGGEISGWPFWVTTPDVETFLPPGGPPNAHFGFSLGVARNFIFSDPSWSYVNYDFGDWREQSAATAAVLNATDPDLSALRDRGGKLIVWHGWSDSALSAYDSIDYYDAVAALDPAADNYARMFLLPGVAHCFGGAGPDKVDWVSAIERWVEQDVAPDQVLAARLDESAAAVLQRPICKYPEVAMYDGTGNPSSPDSFSCATADE